MAEKKRRARGEGSIRQREKDGIWEGRFTLGYDSKTGKTVSRSVYGKTKEDVRNKLTAAIAARDKGTYRDPSKMKLSDWLDIWQREYLVDVKDSTRYLYNKQIRRLRVHRRVPRFRMRGPLSFSQYAGAGAATEQDGPTKSHWRVHFGGNPNIIQKLQNQLSHPVSPKVIMGS